MINAYFVQFGPRCIQCLLHYLLMYDLTDEILETRVMLNRQRICTKRGGSWVQISVGK